MTTVYLKTGKKVSQTLQEEELQEKVKEIIREVQNGGNGVVIELTKRFDRVERPNLLVGKEEREKAWEKVPSTVVQDLRFAAENIHKFAQAQRSMFKDQEMEITPGLFVGHHVIPVENVGVYVPGGRYPLISTVLHGIIPAKVAGVKRIVACSPPSKEASLNPFMLVAMDIAGADEVYAVGGAQAIALMAYGTESISPVDLIVGPGNAFVTEAKRQVFGQVGIDALAGPSEMLLIADREANPQLVAADLLAQVEHDPLSQAVLVTTSESLAQRALKVLKEELDILDNDIARSTWENNGQVILVSDLAEAVRVANEFAPEHLALHLKDWEEILPSLHNYGSLFLGEKAAVVFGDYVSGSNHILPTMGTARFANGLWVGTFLKTCTYQRIDKDAEITLAPIAERLAELEGLHAHARSAQLRFKVHNSG